MTVPALVYNPFTDNFDYADQGGGGGNPYPGGVIAWTDVTGVLQPLSADNGYTANNPIARINFVLPAIIGYGKIFRIVGKEVGLWEVTQNAGQRIYLGNLATTVGVGGKIQSTHARDCIEMLCTVANTEFTIINGPQGNITVI